MGKRQYEQVMTNGGWIRTSEVATKDGRKFISVQTIIDEEYVDIKLGKDHMDLVRKLPAIGETIYGAFSGGLTTTDSGRKVLYLNTLTVLPKPENRKMREF